MNHNAHKTALLTLPQEMRQRAIDLLQLDAIRRVYTQIGYHLQQVTQLQQGADVLRAGFEQKAVGIEVDTGSWEPVEAQVGLQVKSMRNCMKRCVADLVAISDVAIGKGRREREPVPVTVSAEETEQPRDVDIPVQVRPAVKPAAVRFEEG